MAGIPFVDTHFHLHDMKQPELRYGWLEPDAVHPFLGRYRRHQGRSTTGIEDYIAEIRFANVPKAIHVQAAVGIDGPGRRDALAAGLRRQVRLSRRASWRSAIWQSPMPGAVLERHMQFTNVRGIRDFGPGDYLSNPAWQAGYKLLARHDLVSCLDTRLAKFPQILAADRQSARCRALRRPLRHPRAARRRNISRPGTVASASSPARRISG